MTFFKTRKGLILLVALVLIAAAVLWGRKTATPATTTSSIGKVGRQTLVQRVTISGQVSPIHRLDVRPAFTGYIQKIYVKIGDHVKVGDPLVTFSPSLDGNETNYPVRSAVNGIVTQVIRSQGEYVLTDTSDQGLVLRVEDMSQLFISATVPELDIAKVKIGQAATVHLSSLPGENFKGMIQETALSANSKDRWSSTSTDFLIKVVLNTHDARVLPGMSALLDVITSEAKEVLALPHEFIQADGDDFVVTLENGEKRKVTLGLQTDDAAEIKSGLQEGESVRMVDFLSLPKLND